MDPFWLSRDVRGDLWRIVAEAAETFVDGVDGLAAGGRTDRDEVRAVLATFDFDSPMPPHAALQNAVDALRELQPQVGHPRHFGLFDASPTTMGVIGDTLAALFNPCLSSWDGSPFGVETEAHLVSAIANRLGYGADAVDGITTSGGTEANLSATLLALRHRFPEYITQGVRGLPGQPVVYYATSAHPSVPRSARLTGLGDTAACEISLDDNGKMDMPALVSAIRADLAADRIPLMVALTAGTTAEGVIDPLSEGADITRRFGLWLHVDAAWGGAAAMLPEMRPAFTGQQASDSITFDAHKWMSVPLSCGFLLTRHSGLLEQVFDVTSPVLSDVAGRDPYSRSLRWSRNFSGLKLLLSLAVAGWAGYDDALRTQINLGNRLRTGLRDRGWRITNETPLPVVCFIDEQHNDREFVTGVVAHVNKTGAARIFAANVRGTYVVRVCITNHATRAGDIDLLIDLLDAARKES